MDRTTFILENTRVTTPVLCPELILHLITDQCALWYAGERELEALAIGDPYWGFCWAGGQALARYILDHPRVVEGRRVLVFGAGCGIEAVAAARSGAALVLAADTDPFAIEATRLNAELNRVHMETTERDLIGDTLEAFDVLLAGDMFYDPEFSARVFSWLQALVDRGIEVYVADPGRGNIPLEAGTLQRVATYQASADVDVMGEYRVQTEAFVLRRHTSDLRSLS